MAYRPGALYRRILTFLKRCTLQGLPSVNERGRIEPRVTIKAEAVQFRWIQAGCAPPERTPDFVGRLQDALDELRLRDLIEPVQGTVRSLTWRWRRDDGLVVFMEQSVVGSGVGTVTLIGRIAAGRLTGIRSVAHEPATQTLYKLRGKGLELLDRRLRRRRRRDSRREGDDRESQPPLKLDRARMTVTHCGIECKFPPRRKLLFGLLERFVANPNRRVDFDRVRGTGEIWDNPQVEDSTIRGAVTRLRKHLRASGLDAVAEAINTMTDGGHAYLLFDQLKLGSGEPVVNGTVPARR